MSWRGLITYRGGSFILVVLLSVATALNFRDKLEGLTDLVSFKYWYFSTIAQVNGAILGLIIVAISLSALRYGKRTRFVFSKDHFITLPLVTAILILNILISFSGMAKEKSTQIITDATIIFALESFSIFLIYAFILDAINFFEDLPKILSKETKSEIASKLDFEFSDPANKAVLKLVNFGEEIYEIKGTVRTNKDREYLIKREGLGGRFDSDYNMRIEDTIEDIEPGEAVRFDVELEFECPKGEKQKLEYQFIAEQKASGQKKLHFLERPKIITD